MTPLGVAAWVLVAIGIAAAAWGVANRRAHRRVQAAGIVILLVIVGLVVVMYAGMGAFCVPPPGAACM